MNRSEKKNALTLAMYEAMTAAFEGANVDGSVRCVLIAGVLGAFSAGNDLTDFLKAAESTGGLNRPALRFLSTLVRCNKPMVAAVSGVAAGVGTTMLFHCDFCGCGLGCTLFNTVRQPRPDPGSSLNTAGATPDGPAPRVRVPRHGVPA